MSHPILPIYHREMCLQMMRDESIRNGLVIALVCALVQQLSGINNVFNFSTIFLAANGVGPDAVTTIAVLMNVGNVLITVLSVWLMDRAGRRALLLGSASAMVLSVLTPHPCTPSSHPILTPHPHTPSLHPILTPHSYTPSLHPILTPHSYIPLLHPSLTPHP